MGIPREPTPAKYFVALLSAEANLLATVEGDLTALLGAIDARSEILPWSVSRYYQEEMGAGLLRRFISFWSLISPARLAAVKLQTQQVEEKFRWNTEGRRGRRINIDPGYLEKDKIVLASTKNAAHRIYLDYGIYGEATLIYYDGAYKGCRYTYPDYLWPETMAFLNSARNLYLEQLRHVP
ncbi:MAG TPA: DUF4416 family protein [Candidatus Binatia bacterium]|nr:DUF4416 family protein [Candidatus Binatia bacterium]